MTLKWKTKNEIEREDLKGMEIISESLRKIPPRAVVIKKEKWCNSCNNAETSIRGLKNLSKILEKGSCKLILNIINENNLINFSVKDILKIIDENRILTEGSLQRKTLSILTCLGYLEKRIIEVKRKDKTTIKFIFNKSRIIEPKECYDREKDCHKKDWDNWRETKYFN